MPGTTELEEFAILKTKLEQTKAQATMFHFYEYYPSIKAALELIKKEGGDEIPTTQRELPAEYKRSFAQHTTRLKHIKEIQDNDNDSRCASIASINIKKSFINMKDIYGNTLLHYAAQQNKILLTKKLVELGVDINGKDLDGNTPLLTAIQNRNIDLAQKLVERCANINTNLAKKLVELGVDINIQDRHGNTPLLTAIQTESEDFKKLQKELAEAKTMLHFYKYHPIILGNLIKPEGKLPTTLQELTRTDKRAFSHMVLLNKIDEIANNNDDKACASLLITHNNTKLLAQMEDIDGNTLLHYAAQQNKILLAKTLLSVGADINIQDSHGHTPLFIAIKNGNTELAQKLIEKGANINTDLVKQLVEKDVDINTDLVEQLLEKGDNISIDLTEELRQLSPDRNANLDDKLLIHDRNQETSPPDDGHAPQTHEVLGGGNVGTEDTGGL